MPVTHQWKPKPKTEAEPPAPQSPPQQPATGGKKGKGAPQAAEESVGKKGSGSASRWSRKDEKPAKKPEPPKKDEDDDDDDDDEEEEEGGESNQPGRIRNLAGFFATQRDEPKAVKKKRFEVTEEEDTIVAENDPEEPLEGVIRADDPGEWEKPIELEKGWAKNMANLFLNRQQQQQETGSSSKKPFVMDIDEGAETIVLENEPVVLEGVVRSVDKTEDVIGKRGRIKNIAGRFANPQSDGALDGGGGSSYWRDPADDDDDEDDRPSYSSTSTGGKPKWMVELESAKEYGVFENEPEVRSDVVHADDEQPDVISAQHTRNLRKMWSQIERDEGSRDAPAPSRRSDIVIRPRKKEPSPEPEPPPPPVETKPTRRFGGAAGKVGGGAGKFATVYGRQAKKEKTPPPPEPEPEPPPKPVARRGFRQTFLAPGPAQPPPAPVQEPPVSPDPTPDPKNPFKRALKPVPRRK